VKRLSGFGKGLFLSSLFSSIFVFSAFSQNTSESQPNIVFFFVDDMGWTDTSVPFYSEMTELNKRYKTPNMERLANDGVKFTQAYAYAVCSPSRVSLLTGVNAARHKVTNWTLRKDQSPDDDIPVVKSPDWNLNGLSPDRLVPRTFYSPTLPAELKKLGYKTIHVGKAHFGAIGTPGENPLNLGFDVNIAGHAAGGPGSYWGTKDFSAAWRTNGEHIWDVPGLEEYHGKDINLTEALTLEAKKALTDAVEEEKPFYLYMSHYAIHAPWERDDRFYQKYADQGLTEREATYASMIEGMDKSLGDIMHHLEKLGVSDNTIIVFMSDNGVHKEVPQNLPLRGYKLSPYEGGIRVPLIVKWPEIVQPNSQNGDYVFIDDIFPTFLEMAGQVDIQKKYEIDGQSFVTSLIEGEKGNQERAILWHYPNTYYNPPYSILRKGNYKLIYHHADQKLELFNIANDISETRDLSQVQKLKTIEMALLMTGLLQQTGAQMPIIKETNQPVPYPSSVIE